MQSFFGFVSTPRDAGILIHCSQDQSERVIPVRRRLIAQERAMIKSGSIFVFCEQDSGMRRWTDGMRWSKSRVEGQFLVYRRIEPETVDPPSDDSNKRRRLLSSDSTLVAEDESRCSDEFGDGSSELDMRREDSTSSLGKHSRSPSPSADHVLCKKTFAISIDGKVSHVICYYSKADVAEGKLQTPSSMSIFTDVKLPSKFTNPFNYRLHPKGNGSSSQAQKSLPTPEEYADQNYSPSQERFVTVRRLGDPQHLKICLSSNFADFKRIIIHAFNFSMNDQIEILVDQSLVIDGQRSYTKLKTGSQVQVRKVDTTPSKEEMAWLNAVRMRTSSENTVVEDVSELCPDASEAALALAALSGRMRRNSVFHWLPANASEAVTGN